MKASDLPAATSLVEYYRTIVGDLTYAALLPDLTARPLRGFDERAMAACQLFQHLGEDALVRILPALVLAANAERRSIEDRLEALGVAVD